METEPPSRLQRYRSDRRKLLDFILSSGLIREIRTPSGLTTSLRDADLDVLNPDYVLECIQSGGGVLDISKATMKYHHPSTYPVMINSRLGDSYFLLSDPESAGSPPRRPPPPIEVNQNNSYASCSSSLLDPLVGGKSKKFAMSVAENGIEYIPSTPAKKLTLPSLGNCKGLSDDDFCESAYEILLASMVSFGVEIYSFEDKKKEKSSKFLSGLKSKRDKPHLQSQPPDRHSQLIDTIRVQMQISEALDACVRRTLMLFASRRTSGHIDVPQISLGLLSGSFKSDFLNEKSYVQWKKRQANIVEELFTSANHTTNERQTLAISLAKIRNANEWDTTMAPSEHAEVLSAVRRLASVLSSRPGQYGINGETYYWTAGYHLNIRIYEKLLFGLFDILEEGQLIEEADETLKLIMLTWSTLGITQKTHNALFAWVLFQQFVLTDEPNLLDHAIVEVQKILSPADYDGKEDQYVDSLVCSMICNGSEIKSNLVQAIFSSISIWCDSRLQDYHLHFSQNPTVFRRVMTLTLAIGTHNVGEQGEAKPRKSDGLHENISEKLRMYVERSIEAACWRVTSLIGLESKLEKTHPLALLANELRLIADRELNVFCPVLSHRCPEAGKISAILLHQFYGERLEPFLKGVSCLSEDVKLVLPAAYMLDHCLNQLYSSPSEEGGLHSPYSQHFDHYQIGKISGPIILEWVFAQNARIMEWTGRAFDLEDWEPLSHQQKQAPSAVEVFRIVEETVDQFFGLSLPMDVIHLQALLSIIFHTLDAYLVKLVTQLVEKHHLYPSVPPLTRYTEAVFPIIKKKLVECVLLEEEVDAKLKDLTISKLCIRLNTLQYIQKQIDMLEDGIKKSWAVVRPSENRKWSDGNPPQTLESNPPFRSESIDELFVVTFDSIKDTAANVMGKICDFAGARVVFWDLRDSFLFRLYHGSVEGARLENILPQFDTVLDHICGYIDDTLRDRVVSSICSASLEGYVWVLLDGGPSCAFSDSDVTMLEEDLQILKDFFVADGEGLPRSLVEVEAKFAHQILSLFSLQTESIIQLLMTASEHISSGLESSKHGRRSLGDAHTLIRVLCHKKDREASRFLKMQYQLPTSSDYDDETPLKDSSMKSPLVADLMQRSASLRWSETSHSSFRSIKKKLQKATSEIRYTAW